jgi:competence protein ComEC
MFSGVQDITLIPEHTSSVRAPLLWLLVPQVLGYLAGLHLEVPPLICALGGLVLSVGTLQKGTKDTYAWKITWAGCIFGAAFLYGWGWYQMRDPMIRDHGLLELPPRAVEFSIEVRRVFIQEDQHGRVSGIARVGTAPVTLDYIVGRDLYFRAYIHALQGPIVRGDVLRLKGIVQSLSWGNSDDQEFDKFLLRAHVFHASKRSIIAERVRPANAFLQFCHHTNLFFQRTLRDGESPGSDSQADVLVAMMLGEKTALTHLQKEEFRHSGTMHLFAISGLHVGVVAMLVAWLLSLMPVPAWTRISVGLCVLFLYVQITGGQPSAIRAFLMVTFVWGARIIQRKSNPFPALVGSAVFILLLDPAQIRNLGFQFSYAVVSVILLYGLPLAEQLRILATPEFIGIPETSIPLWRRFQVIVKQWFLLVFSISFSATLASTPLTIANFGIATPGTVFLNLFLVSMAGVAIQLGAASLLMGIAGLGYLSSLINSVAKSLISIMVWMVERALQVPGFFQEVTMRNPILGPAGILLFIGVLLTCHHLKRRLRLHFFWIPPVAFIIYILATTIPIKIKDIIPS